MNTISLVFHMFSHLEYLQRMLDIHYRTSDLFVLHCSGPCVAPLKYTNYFCEYCIITWTFPMTKEKGYIRMYATIGKVAYYNVFT